MFPKEPMKNSVFSKNEIGSEILGVSATPTFLTEPLLQNQPLAYKNEKVEIARMPPRLKRNGFYITLLVYVFSYKKSTIFLMKL